MLKLAFAYNARKLSTLEIFLKAYPNAIRPEAYASLIGKLPARAAYSYLKKLHQWGLLWRQENPVRYRISQRGRERLAWLKVRAKTFSVTVLDGRKHLRDEVLFY
jgi:hypothetical protein